MCDYLSMIDKILANLSDTSKWTDKRFGKIKLLSNTKVGSVGEAFFEEVCNALEIPFENPSSARSSWDLKINSTKFEIKTASEDVNGLFQFNHIRYHRTYDAVLLLGISPEKLHFKIYSKEDISTERAGRLVSMEKGANASYKLTKSPEELWPISDLETKLKNI